MIQPQDILQFWFHDITPKFWWDKDSDFDLLITSRFGETHTAAMAGELSVWRDDIKGRLAEIIVLDQFSRNMFRDTAAAFSSDALALALAQEAILSPEHKQLSADERAFLYMPFMHSESLTIHQKAVELFGLPGMNPFNAEFEAKHLRIIEQFGRYPHRNAILGRASTQAELDFLQEPNSSF
jgi:uncharacterized protein (DUF924 family)